MFKKAFSIDLVRIKVKEIIEFIQDDERLREERKKAKKNRDKYVGIDSDCVSTSSSRSGGFSDFSRTGFGSDFKKSNISDLDDKEWRSSNPTIHERISDITSKVKTMLDNPPDNDNNLDISDNDNELGIKNDEEVTPKTVSPKATLDSKVHIWYFFLFQNLKQLLKSDRTVESQKP